MVGWCWEIAGQPANKQEACVRKRMNNDLPWFIDGILFSTTYSIMMVEKRKRKYISQDFFTSAVALSGILYTLSDFYGKRRRKKDSLHKCMWDLMGSCEGILWSSWSWLLHWIGIDAWSSARSIQRSSSSCLLLCSKFAFKPIGQLGKPECKEEKVRSTLFMTPFSKARTNEMLSLYFLGSLDWFSNPD